MELTARAALRMLITVCVVSLGMALCCRAATETEDGKKLAEIQSRAEHGYVDKQIELAAAYLTGRGVPQDAGKAAHWYLKAAESGSPEAENEVGYLYQEGIGVPMDAERAVHWFQLASAGGMARAKVNLGVSYLYGTGVEKNVALARTLFEEAVQQGTGLGATYLGIMAYFGLGGASDKEAAEHWFEEGAKLHDPQAAYDLALLFAAPEGKRHDLHRAVALLRYSAEKGYVAGKHALGLLILNHPELAQENGEAWRELNEASEAGSWKASVLLGVMARDGRMTVADARKAYYFFSLGAMQGAQEGERLVKADLEALRHKLSGDEQKQVAADASAWFEQHRTPLEFIAKAGERERYFPLLASAKTHGDGE